MVTVVQSDGTCVVAPRTQHGSPQRGFKQCFQSIFSMVESREGKIN